MKKFITTLTCAGMLLFAGNAFGQADAKTPAPAPAKVAKPASNSGLQVSTPDEAATPTTKIEFTETSFDFGEIKQGDVVEHTFVFKNTGENDLVLKNVKPTCGCTALDWPKEAVKPGETGEIQTRFNSRGKMGKQYKYFTVEYNGNPAIERVAFTGNVVAPDPAPAEKMVPPGTDIKRDADGNEIK